MRRCPIWDRLMHRVGRRGYFLFMLGVVDVSYGYRMVFPESQAQSISNRYLAEVLWLHSERASLWVWAGLWWATALACFVNAFRRVDLTGFGMAFALKVIWLAANLIAGFHGMPGAYSRCVVWGFIASAVLVVAKWPEPRNSLPEVVAELESTGEIALPRRGVKHKPPEGA